MWTYTIATGEMTDGNHQFFGYSGHGLGLNNPAMEGTRDVGPAPEGLYSIGPWHDAPHLGPCVSLLSPVDHDADGRTGLYIHGDNRLGNHSASDGCIIMDKIARQTMRNSNDTSLNVIKGGEADV